MDDVLAKGVVLVLVLEDGVLGDVMEVVLNDIGVLKGVLMEEEGVLAEFLEGVL